MNNFIGQHREQDTVVQLVADEDSLDVAVAFWGISAQKLIHPDEFKPIRVICNPAYGHYQFQVIEHFLELSTRAVRHQIALGQHPASKFLAPCKSLF
ncbi:hypothetical protein [Pseudomonas sp. ZB1P45]|uniref:hypothetical protein n=1 Tax=Pseudomonas frigoris TaxID=3398356 RepID=UPI0039EF7ADD